MANLLREGATSHPLEFEVGDQEVRHSRGALARLPQGEGDKGERFGGSFGGLQSADFRSPLAAIVGKATERDFPQGRRQGVRLYVYIFFCKHWLAGGPVLSATVFRVFSAHKVLNSPARH